MLSQLAAANADIDVVVIGLTCLERGSEMLEEVVAAFGRESSTGNREVVNEEAKNGVVVGAMFVVEHARVSSRLFEAPLDKKWDDGVVPVVSRLLGAVEGRN